MFVNDVKEKEPLPQSVEVLSHVAARAATFLVFAVTWTAFKWLRIVPRLALSILYSHAGCFLIVPMTQAILLRFNLTQLCGLRPTRKNCLVAMHFNLMLSILCSRVGYVGNSAQRLHFLHNVALCILLSFGAVMVVCC